MAIQEGDKLPDATLHTMQDGKPTPVTTADLFGGKKVVLFAVPGAFTPTCSMAHLPGYVVNADAIKAKGASMAVEPWEFSPGNPLCYVQAPDGVSVEIVQGKD